MHVGASRAKRHARRTTRERGALIAAQDRLRQAHEVAHLSSWEWWPGPDEAVVFEALAATPWLSGMRVGLDELLSVMSPQDRQLARADLEAMVQGEREESMRRYCYDGPGGKAWLETRTRANRDRQGKLLSVRGTTQEVTEQHTATQELLAARNYLRAVADGMGEGLCATDPDGRIVYVNPTAEMLLGWTGKLAVGRVMHDLVHAGRGGESSCVAAECPILRVVQDGVAVRVEDDEFLCRDGSLLPVSYTAAPFVTEDGIEGCAVVFVETTERKAHEENMARDVETLSWIRRIRGALTEDRFELFSQPIVDLRSGAVVQRELLLRMREPDGEIVTPIAFLPIAEQYGLIADIDHWVIERGCQIATELGAVQLNLSAHSIGRPAIIDRIEQCLKRTGADPASLVFEITETALIADEGAAKTFADRLRALGCRLALDDFGTGYGGFTYLKQLPVDQLKIDIEFVGDLSTNTASQHVVAAVVALARAFGLQTVAEGVEDARAFQMLREFGVDLAQGYYIARPAPIGQSTSILELGAFSPAELLPQSKGRTQ